MGVEWIVISGGELEHKQAGRPGELIRDRYRDAAQKWNLAENKVCVLLINDFDTGIGIWSGQNENTIFQYTVNLQNVYGTLMNIVDHPTVVDGLPCHRIPIIITGNNFGTLHEPLVRDGRMTKFRWQPSNNEKLQVAFSIFADLGLKDAELRNFIERHANQKVAFFAHVRSTLIDVHINSWLKSNDLFSAVRTVLMNPGKLNIDYRVTSRDLDLAAQKVMSEHLPNQ